MTKNVLPLGKYRKYNAYQAMFDICAKADASVDADARFRKAILIIVKWLKDRYAKSEPDNASSSDFIRQYPEPEDYANFDPAMTDWHEATDEDEIKICYYRADDSSTEQWAILISEPGLKQESFITDISVKKREDKVVLAVRGAIKVPAGYDEEISYYRPAFIRMLVNDPMLCITEADTKYSFGKTALHINGKSSSECSDFREGFIDNPARQLPVFFISQQTAEELGSENEFMPAPEENVESEPADDKATPGDDKVNADPGRNIIDAATYASMGYAHIVVVDGSTRKLFANTEYESYADRLDAGEFVRLGTPATKRDYNTYFELNEKKQMTGSFITQLRQSMERFPYDFGDTEFYRELYLRKREEKLNRLMSGEDDTIDPNTLLDQVNILNYEIDVLRMEKDQENQDHRLEIADLNRKINKLTNDLNKQKNYSDSLKEQQQLLKQDNKVLSDKVDEAVSANEQSDDTISMTTRDYAGRHRGILNPPAKFQKDMLVEWIDKYYPDTIILHNRARHSIESAGVIEDQRCRIIVAMIHYLHGCTIYWNEGNNDLDSENTVMQEYVPYNYSFEIAPVGKSTTDEYKSSYQIDISDYDKNAGTILMSQHMKYGKGFGNDPSMVRIYYYYDKSIGKTIIGDLPNHLPTYNGGR